MQYRRPSNTNSCTTFNIRPYYQSIQYHFYIKIRSRINSWGKGRESFLLSSTIHDKFQNSCQAYVKRYLANVNNNNGSRINVQDFFCLFMAVLWAVVNNAGIAHAGQIDWTSVKEIQQVYNVNAAGTLRVTKCFLPFLKKSKGRIVNVTSHGGK